MTDGTMEGRGRTALEVLAVGLPATIQDGGRPDAAPLGVPRSGACDPLASASANLLLGNAPDAPVLEMPLLGPTFRVVRAGPVASAGADMEARVVDGAGRSERLRSGHVAWLPDGARLEMDAAQDGARGYLALPGGIDVPRVLGSASTAPVGGIGGYAGRAIAIGDLLEAAEATDGAGPTIRWLGPGAASGIRPGDAPRIVRVVAGPHASRFPASEMARFLGFDWEVSPRSDRVGIRLDGATLAQEGAELPSMGMIWGAVQVPPGGKPIVLLADAPTVGGYPVIAVVIAADRPVCGQLRAGDRVRFARVSPVEALAALERGRADLDEARRRLAAHAR